MKTNEAAKKLCPRTCGDCCCSDHHWGIYGDCDMKCKHCPATLSWDEVCVVCKHTLGEHDIEEDWACQFCDGPLACKRFRFEGQAVRNCKNVHPWDIPKTIVVSESAIEKLVDTLENPGPMTPALRKLAEEEPEPCIKCKQAPGVCTCTGGPLYEEGPDIER